jgi:hypothetical protein
MLLTICMTKQALRHSRVGRDKQKNRTPIHSLEFSLLHSRGSRDTVESMSQSLDTQRLTAIFGSRPDIIAGIQTAAGRSSR